MTAANQIIADRLREAADLLEQQAANPFRVRAYREAAKTAASLAEDLGELHERAGVAALDALPGIGPRIAAAIVEMLRTARWSQLERLRRSLDPERLFRAIPGVGPALARRVHEALHVDTLANSRWCSRTPAARTSWARRTTGSSSTFMTTPPPRGTADGGNGDLGAAGRKARNPRS